MGLDQFAYVAARAGQRREYYEQSEWDQETKTYVNPAMHEPREIAYWRKHPNLQGWMESLWLKKSYQTEEDVARSSFNGIELELTWEDLEELEQAIKNKKLPATSGFFFGDAADERYFEHDLDFVRKAKSELFLGLKVFYNSSW